MTLSSHDHGMEILAGRWQAQDIAQELASCHVYAAEFGTVLEWCTERTDSLFAGGVIAGVDHSYEAERSLQDKQARSFSDAMARAAVAYTQIRDARRVERVLGGEAA